MSALFTREKPTAQVTFLRSPNEELVAHVKAKPPQ